MRIPGLTASVVEGYAAEGSFERGRQYVDSGAVVLLRQTGPGHLEARVKGSHYVPYAVDVRFDDHGIAEVECSCPYFAGGWCKHIVAALLVHLEGSQSALETRVGDALSKLDRAEIVSLLETIAGKHPEIVGWMIEQLKHRDRDAE